MKRIKLADRVLPRYSRGEEIMNMVTHIVGGGLGVLILINCLFCTTRQNGSDIAIVGSTIYGISMISVYCISSIYHGLRVSTAKKVLQIIDHCMIYFLIAGTYTPILLVGFVPHVPIVGWGLLAAEWILGIAAATLTAIDLRRYRVFSMICYILMGWGIIFFLPTAISLLTPSGFYLLLSGGIVYTVGAIVYGIGSKIPWMHSVFHIFVVLGSLLQFLSIYWFILT